MFGWFGRKGAPDAVSCAYAPPPWLAAVHEEGFATGYEGQLREVYQTNPVGLRSVRLVAGAIADDASGAASQGKVNAILAALRTHGLIA